MSAHVLQVRWRSNVKFGNWVHESATAQHYRGLLNDRPSVTWEEVLLTALQEADRSRVP